MHPERDIFCPGAISSLSLARSDPIYIPVFPAEKKVSWKEKKEKRMAPASLAYLMC